MCKFIFYWYLDILSFFLYNSPATGYSLFLADIKYTV